MLEEIGEVVVEEENKDESDGCNEDDENDGVGEATFELDGGGVGGILDVYEVGGGTDVRVGSIWKNLKSLFKVSSLNHYPLGFTSCDTYGN